MTLVEEETIRTETEQELLVEEIMMETETEPMPTAAGETITIETVGTIIPEVAETITIETEFIPEETIVMVIEAAGTTEVEEVMTDMTAEAMTIDVTDMITTAEDLMADMVAQAGDIIIYRVVTVM
jgi:hypothetical protein